MTRPGRALLMLPLHGGAPIIHGLGLVRVVHDELADCSYAVYEAHCLPAWGGPGHTPPMHTREALERFAAAAVSMPFRPD